MSKKLLIKQAEQAFNSAQKHVWMDKLMTLPLPIRYVLGIVLILFGIIGMLTPIPLGMVFFLIGVAIFSGLARARNMTFRIIYWLRLHIFYGKLYGWWKNRR